MLGIQLAVWACLDLGPYLAYVHASETWGFIQAGTEGKPSPCVGLSGSSWNGQDQASLHLINLQFIDLQYSIIDWQYFES